MGVNGLWTLISPVARPIKLETMGNKRLAIDSSIWLYQFQNAMRDKEGRALVNAHILGFLRRICKLLYYGIKPIFVFDGGAPVLKRITIGERKKRKRGGQENLAKTAEKLLAAQMRQAAVKEAQRRAQEADTGDVIDENTRYLEEPEDFDNVNVIRRKGRPAPSPSASTSQRENAKSQSPEVPKKKKYVPKDQYALPILDEPIQAAASRSSGADPRLATEAELRDFIDDMRPEDFDISSPLFASLPTEVKYEIIGDLRIKSRQTNRKRVEEMRLAPTALDFSRAQIRNLMERNNLTQKLLDVTDMVSKANLTIPVKIAGQRNKEYVLVKNTAEAGGGWVLGVRDGVMTNPDAEGSTRARPVTVEGESTTEDEGSAGETASMDEFEEISIPSPAKSNPGGQERSPTPDMEHRHRQTMRAIQQRYGGPLPQPGGPYDPDLDAPIADTDARGLFQEDDAFFGAGEEEGPQEGPSGSAVRQREAGRRGDESEEQQILREIAAEVEKYDRQRQQKRRKESEAGEVGSEESGAEFEEVIGPIAGPSGTNPRDDEAIPRASRISPRQTLSYQQAEGDSDIRRDGVPSTVARALEMEETSSDDDESVEFEEVRGVPSPKAKKASQAQTSIGATSPVAQAHIDRRTSEVAHEEAIPRKPLATAPLPLLSGAAKQPAKEAPFLAELQPQSEGIDKRLLAKDQTKAKANAAATAAKSSSGQGAKSAIAPTNGGHVGEAVEEEREEETARPTKRVRANPSKHERLSEESNGVIAKDFAKTPPMSPSNVQRQVVPLPATGKVSAATEGEVDRMEPSLDVRLELSVVPPGQPSCDRVAAVALEQDAAETAKQGEEAEEEGIPWSPSPEPQPRPPPEPMSMDDAIRDFPLADIGHELSEGDDVPDEDAEAAANLQDEATNWSDFLSQLQNRNLDDLRAEVDAEVRNLTDQRTKDRRGVDDITVQMSKEVQVMLRLFGIPYVVAPMEAEAQCAELLARSLVDGIITDDSDVFLFGGSRIYKNMFNQNKYVECYLLSDLERELSLDREKLVRLAYLLGSDYVDGLPGVGPVSAMEVMREFPGSDGLMGFRDWWKKVQTGKDGKDDNLTPFRRKFRRNKDRIWLDEGWPNPAVLDAYYYPTVDESDQRFVWGIPDLDGLRQFLMEHLSWSSSKTDDLLIPLIKRQTQRIGGVAHTQGVLDGFFDITAGSGTYAPRQRAGYSSQRLQNIVKDWREAQKKQRAVEAAQTAHGGSDEDIEAATAPGELREETLGKRQAKVKPIVRRLPGSTTTDIGQEPDQDHQAARVSSGSTLKPKPKRPRAQPSAGAIAASIVGGAASRVSSSRKKRPKDWAIQTNSLPGDSTPQSGNGKGKGKRKPRVSFAYRPGQFPDDDDGGGHHTQDKASDGDDDDDYVEGSKSKRKRGKGETSGRGKGKARAR